MPQATRDIKRRIKSVHGTKKITKAMELVSAAKMRKAVHNVLATRSYANMAWELARRLSAKTSAKRHPLLQERKGSGKIGLIVVTSNKGLCGGFNNQLILRAANFIKHQKTEMDMEAELVIMGKKGREALHKKGYTIIAEFNKLDITAVISEITPVAKMIIKDYLCGRYDKVMIAYTDFISPLVQRPRVLQLLPIKNLNTEDKYLGIVKFGGKEEMPDFQALLQANYGYIYEPRPYKVLDQILPRLLETQIYQAILESDASEQSARMVAMQNATEAAKDMISALTLAFNKARQSAITAELADISGGVAAVE